MLSCDIFDELSHVGVDFSTNCCSTKEMRHSRSGKRQNVVLLIKNFMLIPYNGIFADKAIFCNPNSPDDIKQKIEQALLKPPYVFSESEANTYNWGASAAQLKMIYNHLLTSR